MNDDECRIIITYNGDKASINEIHVSTTHGDDLDDDSTGSDRPYRSEILDGRETGITISGVPIGYQMTPVPNQGIEGYKTKDAAFLLSIEPDSDPIEVYIADIQQYIDNGLLEYNAGGVLIYNRDKKIVVVREIVNLILADA